MGYAFFLELRRRRCPQRRGRGPVVLQHTRRAAQHRARRGRCRRWRRYWPSCIHVSWLKHRRRGRRFPARSTRATRSSVCSCRNDFNSEHPGKGIRIFAPTPRLREEAWWRATRLHHSDRVVAKPASAAEGDAGLSVEETGWHAVPRAEGEGLFEAIDNHRALGNAFIQQLAKRIKSCC